MRVLPYTRAFPDLQCVATPPTRPFFVDFSTHSGSMCEYPVGPVSLLSLSQVSVTFLDLSAFTDVKGSRWTGSVLSGESSVGHVHTADSMSLQDLVSHFVCTA